MKGNTDMQKNNPYMTHLDKTIKNLLDQILFYI